MKQYVKIMCKDKVVDINGFAEAFEQYIQQRPIDKNGQRSISLSSFRDFLTLQIHLKKVKFI
ncbi:hypothetical protein LJK88_25555 [Paenibacillus sp. P26]|nr:hypothetical protein LJK88_25555 [Paenibacillus sp. P26]